MRARFGVFFRVAVAAAAVATAVLVVGCGGGGTSSSGSSSSTGKASGEAKATAGGTLHFALESEPETLNPPAVIEGSALIVLLEVAEGLYLFNEEGEVEPNLATNSKTSADGRIWTFTLAKGVKFSNGQAMTSKDVLFSLEQARHSPLYSGFYEDIASISAPNPGTITIKTKEPAPALPAQLASYTADVIPANFGGVSAKEFGQKPIGTGPFQVASWHRGGELVLEQSPSYWKSTKPHLESIVFTAVTDETSRLSQIRGGQLDMTKATPLAVKTGVAPGSGVRVEETAQTIVDYLLLNQNNPSFEDPRMREAINLAVDRQGLIKAATDGKGQEGASYLPPATTYSTELKPPARDEAKAKTLAAEAIVAGADPSFTIRYYNFDAYSALASQVIQQNLEEIGLTVKLLPLDEAALNELLETGEYEAVLGLYYPALSDPSEITQFYLSFYASHNGADVKAQTKVAGEALTEIDSKKRAALYAELQKMVAEEESMLVLNYQPIVYPVQEKVTGIQFDPVGNVLLRTAGFAE
jgi:peptide/nickel transport system substrate-binding protein